MQLFKETNFDFLKWKWVFIGISLVLVLAGVGSLYANGGPKYGIDFTGGAEMKLRFVGEPPVEQIRTALGKAVEGEVSVQRLTDRPDEVLVGTEIADETELNQRQQLIETTLRDTLGANDGKPDFNNASAEDVGNTLRTAFNAAGISFSESQLTDLVAQAKAFQVDQGGILTSFDQLSGLEGITPEKITAMKNSLSLAPFNILSTDMVGPKIGAELRNKAIQATLFALAGMLIYIAFRFEWIYGVAAVVAVFHDVVITIGLFSIFDKEISLTVIAALLTLVGYSMNDTIVVFDRIRENLKTMRRESFPTLVNLSVNQTLNRTVLTAGLTFLTAVSLLVFGGDVLNGFSFALVVGIMIGTYSSIFIASPILIFWKDFGNKGAAAPAGAGKVAAKPVKEPAAAKAGAVSTGTQPAAEPRQPVGAGAGKSGKRKAGRRK